MKGTKEATNLSTMLETFNNIYSGSPTRLGVFEELNDVVIDNWIEDGLPLVGLDVEHRDGGKMSIQIMLKNKVGSKDSHFTHVVKDVRLAKIILSDNGISDGLDITDHKGHITVLRFEKY